MTIPDKPNIQYTILIAAIDMSGRWDFGHIPSERSLEKKVIFRQKHTLTNSRGRTQIWLYTRHQDELIEPRRERSIADEGALIESTIERVRYRLLLDSSLGAGNY